MANAKRLAHKIRRIIQRHIQNQDYEIVVVKEVPNENALNRRQLSIHNKGQPQPSEIEIKIVVTAHKLDTNPTEYGDNPDKLLEFISIEDGSEESESQVVESCIIQYDEKRYKVEHASPAYLGGLLVIKECIARSLR